MSEELAHEIAAIFIEAPKPNHVAEILDILNEHAYKQNAELLRLREELALQTHAAKTWSESAQAAFKREDALRADLAAERAKVRELEEALEAATSCIRKYEYYVDASDQEILEDGTTRELALVRARDASRRIAELYTDKIAAITAPKANDELRMQGEKE
jgi:hypothetical protein